MNWGYKIAIVYIAFVAMILSFVFRAAMQDFSLVRTDYYAAEQSYVAQRAAQIRAEALPEALDINLRDQGQALQVHFPGPNLPSAGKIHLYRPSDSDLDQQFALALDGQGNQVIDLSQMTGGRWQVLISWQTEGQTYFSTQDLVIP